jgi:large subunit ribosomal protein L4
MELAIRAAANGQNRTLAVSDESFAVDFNEGLVHQVVTAYLAGGRSGNSAQKTRSEVRGGGKKPWRQKGTGRARAGTIRSPIWRSGGVTFAAKPRNYSQKVNRKMYRAAMRSILSELIRQDRLLVIEDLKLDQPKTKELTATLRELSINSSVLIVTEQVDAKLALAGRNIHTVGIYQSDEISPLHLLQYEVTLITAGALKHLEERLG